MPTLIQVQAIAMRDLARRTRRLARHLLLESDQERFLKYADELELEAEALERLASEQRSGARPRPANDEDDSWNPRS
jgi:hypothetical protein